MSKDQNAGTGRNVKWVEGLRGMAAFLVVTSHLARAFGPTMSDPQESKDKLGSIFHLTILRVYAQGSPWVGLFFLLTGYVNILSPVKKARDGNHSQALTSLASSVFRRPFRLILPTAIAGFFAWLFCQLGFYALAAQSDAWWMRFTSPMPDESFNKAVRGLFWNSFIVWKTGEMFYEKNQWSLPFLLKGSMMVYLVLLGTIRCTPRARMSIFALFWALSWIWNDAMIGLNVYAGAFLAELNMELGTAHAFPRLRSIPATFFSFLVVLLGLHWCSYPETHNEWATWSANLGWWGLRFFPKGADQYRFWPALGTQLVTIAVMISPPLQHLLSLPFFVWLGGVSFPLYLLHGPLIRSFLAWLLFGFREPVKKGDEMVLPMPHWWMYFFALPIFFATLFAASHVWNLYVEPWCAYWTQKAEAICFGTRPAERSEGSGGANSKQNGILLS